MSKRKRYSNNFIGPRRKAGRPKGSTSKYKTRTKRVLTEDEKKEFEKYGLNYQTKTYDEYLDWRSKQNIKLKDVMGKESYYNYVQKIKQGIKDNSIKNTSIWREVTKRERETSIDQERALIKGYDTMMGMDIKTRKGISLYKLRALDAATITNVGNFINKLSNFEMGALYGGHYEDSFRA